MEANELFNALNAVTKFSTDSRAIDSASENTLGSARRIFGIARPQSTAEVVQIVKVANQFHAKLYPFSCGRNWGYGSKLPVQDGCILVDLSDMNRVVEFDPELGVVTIEPGVTQQILYDFLVSQNAPFMVPTTGAGPAASILGNALERGFGITPLADHFDAVRSLEVVLSDGKIFHPLLSSAGASATEKISRWGVGPYLTGLFSQGSFGIVTKMTIHLIRKPEVVTLFRAELSDEQLQNGVHSIREIMHGVGGFVGGINLMNRYRVQAMSPKADHPDWTVLGNVYTPKRVGGKVSQHIASIFKVKAIQSKRISSHQVQCLRPIYGRLKKFGYKNPHLEFLMEAFDISYGKPSVVALNILSKKGFSDDAINSYGLIWFAPLVPMKFAQVKAFVDTVTRVMTKFSFEPKITFTAVSSNCFDATIPIIFDKSSKADAARQCYEELFSACLSAHHIVPYRLDIESMKKLSSIDCAANDVLRRVKKALDPTSMFSPGRYIHE